MVVDQSEGIYLKHRLKLLKWYEGLLTEFFGQDPYWTFFLRTRSGCRMSQMGLSNFNILTNKCITV